MLGTFIPSNKSYFFVKTKLTDDRPSRQSLKSKLYKCGGEFVTVTENLSFLLEKLFRKFLNIYPPSTFIQVIMVSNKVILVTFTGGGVGISDIK